MADIFPRASAGEKLFSVTDSWRVFRIVAEFVDGFEAMAELGPSVSIFGSARLQPGTPYYNLAVDVAQKTVERGFSIITGGGPGIMEAANEGAQKARGKSCGLVIDLPWESEANPYVDPKFNLKFRYFFIRKVMFIRYAEAFIFMPGGFGTLDEMFEALTLVQTRKIDAVPIYLMGAEYWSGLLEWVKATQLASGCISESDLDLFTVTDDPEEVARDIERHYRQNLPKKP